MILFVDRKTDGFQGEIQNDTVLGRYSTVPESS